MNVTDRSHEPAAVFEAWLADVEARPAAPGSVEAVTAALAAAVDGGRTEQTWLSRHDLRALAVAALSAVHDRDGQR